ncbi:MAG: hypothetical protein EOO15_02515 [Chitinophagaceae bacterium]|nr:MAG: hypothetical protein EOO15_02515 [Chitinophagaceae bacterium]
MRSILIILLSLAATGGFAQFVNTKNGNFNISYTDASTNEDLAITRSFNSINTSKGYFGVGWSSIIETRLVPLPDGAIGIEWWGGITREVFPTAQRSKDQHNAMIRAVVQAEIAIDRLANTPAEILRRKGELHTSDVTLYIKYMELLAAGTIKQERVLPARKQTWRIDTNQDLEWDGKRYRHHSWDQYYYYDSLGRLTRIDASGARMDLRYAGALLDRVLLDQRLDCKVDMDTSGRIREISLEDSGRIKKAVYRYDSLQRLIYTTDIADNRYQHSYDAVANMTMIGYADGTRMQIEYDPATFRVTRLVSPNGKSEQYDYVSFYNEFGENDPNHFATRITEYDSVGRRIFNKYQEWEYRTLPDGGDYLYRILNRSDTSISDNIYDPNVGNVTYRKLNEHEAWAGYDGKHRCTYLRMNDTVFRVQYRLDEKPERFWAIDSLRRDTILYLYFYNSSGKLTSVLRGKERYSIEAIPSDSVQVIRKGNTRWRITFAKGKPVHASSKAWPQLDLRTNAADPAKRKAQAEARSFAEAVELKSIPHEWVWEKLGKKGG